MAPVWRNTGKQILGEWGGWKRGTIRTRRKWTTAIAEGCCEISFDPSGERLKKITCWQFCSAFVKRFSSCWPLHLPKNRKKRPRYKEKELKRYSLSSFYGFVYYVSNLLQVPKNSSYMTSPSLLKQTEFKIK